MLGVAPDSTVVRGVVVGADGCEGRFWVTAARRAVLWVTATCASAASVAVTLTSRSWPIPNCDDLATWSAQTSWAA